VKEYQHFAKEESEPGRMKKFGLSAGRAQMRQGRDRKSNYSRMPDEAMAKMEGRP